MQNPSDTLKIKTYYWPKPISIRLFDWTAVEDSYEPGMPIGYGRTEQEAIDDLKNQVEIDAEPAD